MGAAEVIQLDEDLLLKKLDEIPSLPSIVYELGQVINDPMCATTDIERIMSKDVGMTAKVLKLANSAYYAIPGGVSNLSRAIAFIGFDTINQLVLSSSIIEALGTSKPSEFDVNEFWIHAIGVGVAAETIAKYTNQPVPADLFTCGLVHDMGKIAIFITDDKFLASVSNYAIENELTIDQAEDQLKVSKHTIVGMQLAEKWLLPKQIQSVIRYHHRNDTKQRGGISDDMNKAVDTVLLANLLIHALKFGHSGHKKILGAPNEVMTRLQLNPKEDFPLLLKEIKKQLDKAGDFIRTIGGNE